MNGTCLDCGRNWSGHSESHCSACCAHFTSDRAFDAHLASPVSDSICSPPPGLQRKDGLPLFIEVDRAHGKAWQLNRPESDGSWFASLRPTTGRYKS